MNICILGAGWFGCFIADELIKKGYLVDVYEKEKDIFLNASGNNQNRLHLGFHYPRSLITRKLSIDGFKIFKKKFKLFSKKIKNNFYAVAKNEKSKINFKYYCSILKSSKLKFKKTDVSFLPYLKNIEGIIKCDEELILLEYAKNYYKNNLKKNIFFNHEIRKIIKKNKKFIVAKKEYDIVINCTWFQFFFRKKIKNIVYEYCSILLYRCVKINHPAITIMDGPFFTLYPWDQNKNYGLYSVKYSRILIDKNFVILKKKVSKTVNRSFLLNVKKKIENEYLHFYPLFKNNFRFVKFLNSYRTIIKNKNDSRKCMVVEKNNFIDIMSGKIDHIFYALKQVEKCLKKF
jgi:hypothetical protein